MTAVADGAVTTGGGLVPVGPASAVTGGCVLGVGCGGAVVVVVVATVAPDGSTPGFA